MQIELDHPSEKLKVIYLSKYDLNAQTVPYFTRVGVIANRIAEFYEMSVPLYIMPQPKGTLVKFSPTSWLYVRETMDEIQKMIEQ